MILSIKPPLGGIHRSFGYQEQPDFTAIDILNMWPFNPADGRRVLATRPPLTNILSPGVGVNLLAPVTAGGSGKPQQGLVAAAGSDLSYWSGTAWVASGGAQASAISTGRAVFASPLGKYLVIANDTDLLVYDYAANSCATIVASAGTSPTGCTVIATHFGSIMCAGKAGSENVIFASKTGDHTNWDYSQTDEAAAFSTDLEISGKVNEAIGALAPHTEDRLVIGCPNSMWVMYRHLSRGGEVNQLSPSIGILGNGAWCIDIKGDMYFMSKGGLGVLPPGGMPTLVSKKKMPDALRGLVYDYTNPNISMAYSSRWNCIYIAVTGDQAQSWMYDIESGGFQRMSFDAYPTVMMAYAPFDLYNKCPVLWGGTNYGGLAQFDRLGSETNRPYYRVMFGPVKLAADSMHRGRVRKIRVILGANANDENSVLSMWTGVDAEDAFTRAFNDLSSRKFTVSLETLQRNGGTCYPHLIGGVLQTVLSGRDNGNTILEGIDMEVEPAGLNRDLRVIGYGYDLGSGLDNYDPGMGGGYNSGFGYFGSPEYGTDAELHAGGGAIIGTGAWSGTHDDPFDDGVGGSPATGTAGYVSYSLASVPGETLTDYSHMIDLSLIDDDAWWTAARDTGGDVRVTNSSNVEIPIDLLSFDKTERTGWAVAKLTQTGVESLRVWAGTGLSFQRSVNHAAGRYAAYDSSWEFFWRQGFGEDRLSGSNTLAQATWTVPGTLGAIADIPTPIAGPRDGLTAARFASVPALGIMGSTAAGVARNVPISIIAYAKWTSSLGFSAGMIGELASVIEQQLLLSAAPSGASMHAQNEDTMASAGVATLTTTALDVWQQFSGISSGASSRQIGVGTTFATNTDTAAIAAPDRFALFSNEGSGGQTVDLSLLQIHAVARSQIWLSTQRSMLLDPANFWTVAAFSQTEWPN